MLIINPLRRDAGYCSVNQVNIYKTSTLSYCFVLLSEGRGWGFATVRHRAAFLC